MLWINILIFIGALFVLIRSGTWVLQSLSRIARFLGWSEFIVAFILVAFVSSLPELFIGLSSAFHGRPEISFGNIIGANIVNLTLAVGLAALLGKGIQIERKIVKRDSIYTAIVAILPLILILDGVLSRPDGFILLFLFAIYLCWLFSQKERFFKVYNNSQRLSFKNFLKDVVMFFLSIGLLLVSAEFIINSTVALAKIINLPIVIIGILLIGAGTALPEAYFSIRAAMRGKEGMVLGNLMGAVIITSLFVLGMVALIHPIEIVDFSPYFIARIFLFLAAVLFFFFVRTGERISRKEALFFLLVYIAFVVLEIWLK